MTSPTDSIASGRPGSRTLTITENDYACDRTTRIGLTLDEVVDSYLDDYRTGLEASSDPDRYRADEPDLAVWEGSRLLAVVKQVPDGDPEVIRLAERGDWDTPALSPRGRFRSFAVLLVDGNVDPGDISRYAGFGMTLEDVFRHENRTAKDAFEHSGNWGEGSPQPNGPEAVAFAAAYPDLLAMEGCRAVAVMRMTPAGELAMIPIGSSD